MKKNIPVLMLTCLMILTLLLVACGGQETATTTTTTQSTSTTTTTLPASTTTTTTTTTTTHTTTQTQTTTTTTTTTQTITENPFSGTITGNWTGTSSGRQVNGVFSMTIDANGNVTGTSGGSYSGIFSGHVDIDGNLNASGNVSLNGMDSQVQWQGKLVISGQSISITGTWSTSDATGTFSGTGTTSPPPPTQNPFHCIMSGNWTGTTSNGEQILGTFTVIIDANGIVAGTFSGSYVGTLIGNVDLNGNLEAIGSALVGGLNIQMNWHGTSTISGNTVNAQGTWTGPMASGTFTGTGQTS